MFWFQQSLHLSRPAIYLSLCISVLLSLYRYLLPSLCLPSSSFSHFLLLLSVPIGHISGSPHFLQRPFLSAICHQSLDLFCILSYYIRWVKTSWTYSILCVPKAGYAAAARAPFNLQMRNLIISSVIFEFDSANIFERGNMGNFLWINISNEN